MEGAATQIYVQTGAKSISNAGKNGMAWVCALLVVLESIVLAVCHHFTIPSDTEAFAMLCIALNSFPICLWGFRETEDRLLFIIFLLGYFARLALLFIDLYGMRIMYSGGDTEAFFRAAAGGRYSGWNGQYYTWLWAVFRVVGPVRLWAQYVNLFFSMAACMLVLDMLHMLHISRNAKRWGFAAICLLPSYLCLSVILLRESSLIYFLALSLYFYVQWYITGDILRLCKALLCTLPLIHLHGGMISVPIAYIGGYLLYNGRRSIIRVRPQNVLLLFGVGICLLYLLPLLGLNKLKSLSFDNILYSVRYGQEVASSVGSSYLENMMIPENWLELAYQTPLRILYFLFSPVPWEFRGIQDIAAFVLSGLPIVFVAGYAILAIFSGKKHRNILLFLLAVVLLFSIVYGWGTVAAGTAMRHRDKIVPVYALLLALSIDARAKRHIANAVPGKLVDTASKFELI